MKFFTHPFWSVGFRPFFALACIAGAVLPLWWALAFTAAVPPAPSFVASPLQWHAHEMFYGFGWAGLGGFLLTATKNWVNVRGWHGGALVFLVAAWLLDRLAMSVGADRTARGLCALAMKTDQALSAGRYGQSARRHSQ
jgi:uncharacterized protein involved in response to NO